jgi:hypothetical protein
MSYIAMNEQTSVATIANFTTGAFPFLYSNAFSLKTRSLPDFAGK